MFWCRWYIWNDLDIPKNLIDDDCEESDNFNSDNLNAHDHDFISFNAISSKNNRIDLPCLKIEPIPEEIATDKNFLWYWNR